MTGYQQGIIMDNLMYPGIYAVSDHDFEAIGRCKVLKEDIERLKIERNSAAGKLREIANLSKGDYQNVVPAFSYDRAQSSLDALQKANDALMAAIEEFNEWADKAGERTVNVKFRP